MLLARPIVSSSGCTNHRTRPTRSTLTGLQQPWPDGELIPIVTGWCGWLMRFVSGQLGRCIRRDRSCERHFPVTPGQSGQLLWSVSLVITTCPSTEGKNLEAVASLVSGGSSARFQDMRCPGICDPTVLNAGSTIRGQMTSTEASTSR